LEKRESIITDSIILYDKAGRLGRGRREKNENRDGWGRGGEEVVREGRKVGAGGAEGREEKG